MKKQYWALVTFAAISFVLGIGCLIAFEILPSIVPRNHVLFEPSFLLPIGYIFLAITLALTCWVVVRVSMLTVKEDLKSLQKPRKRR